MAYEFVGVGVLLLLGVGSFAYGVINRATEVDVVRVHAIVPIETYKLVNSVCAVENSAVAA